MVGKAQSQTCQNQYNLKAESDATDSIVLQQDEHLLATLSVVGLIENNQTEDGAEPELLDEGEFIVTTVRGVFVGKSVTHDFQWTKLVSHKNEPLMNNVVVYLPVSNRQMIYGIAAEREKLRKEKQHFAGQPNTMQCRLRK